MIVSNLWTWSSWGLFVWSWHGLLYVWQSYDPIILAVRSLTERWSAPREYLNKLLPNSHCPGPGSNSVLDNYSMIMVRSPNHDTGASMFAVLKCWMHFPIEFLHIYIIGLLRKSYIVLIGLRSELDHIRQRLPSRVTREEGSTGLLGAASAELLFWCLSLHSLAIIDILWGNTAHCHITHMGLKANFPSKKWAKIMF